jgi:hypothetical protein
MWSYCNGRPAQEKKYKYFPRWSYYNGQPTQEENAKIFQSGLIVMGDLPRRKNAEIFQRWTTCQSGKIQRFSKWSNYNRRPAHVKNTMIF